MLLPRCTALSIVNIVTRTPFCVIPQSRGDRCWNRHLVTSIFPSKVPKGLTKSTTVEIIATIISTQEPQLSLPRRTTATDVVTTTLPSILPLLPQPPPRCLPFLQCSTINRAVSWLAKNCQLDISWLGIQVTCSGANYPTD